MKSPLSLAAQISIALAMGNERNYNPAANPNSKSGGHGHRRFSRSKGWKKVFGGLAVPSVASSRFA